MKLFAVLLIIIVLFLESGLISKHQFYKVSHPTLGWGLAPNLSFYNVGLFYTSKFSTNNLGLRDLPRSYENTQDKLRVLILGDSILEGKEVGDEATFARQLELLLNSGEEQYEVINSAMTGYSTLQQVLYYSEFGKQYQPKVVLLGVSLENDLVESFLPLQKNLIGGSSSYPRRPYLVGPDDWRILELESNQGVNQASEKTMLKTPKLVMSIFRDLTRYWRFLRKQNRKPRHHQDCSAFELYQKVWNGYENLLVNLKNEVQKHGGELVVFAGQVGYFSKGILIPIGTKNERSVVCQDPEAESRLIAMLNKNNIKNLSLDDTFKTDLLSARNPNVQYFNLHWTKQGHKRAAELVHQHLKQDLFN